MFWGRPEGVWRSGICRWPTGSWGLLAPGGILGVSLGIPESVLVAADGTQGSGG